MIAHLRGEIIARDLDAITLDVNGVGYRIAVSAQTLTAVPHSGTVSLHTHLVVRDDALSLYGFSEQSERGLFLMLLGVPSVGPKLALTVLSGGSVSDLYSAVANGDIDRLKAVPGIGKRTAERIVVELKQRIEATIDLSAAPTANVGQQHVTAKAGLLGLGFSESEADKLLDGSDGSTPEELITAALVKARS